MNELKTYQKKWHHFESWFILLIVLAIWQVICYLEIIPANLLPSPIQIGKAMYNNAGLLLRHTSYTFIEAVIGLIFGVLGGFLIAFAMIYNPFCRRIFSPFMVITQSIPSVALAPLLVLWLGDGMAPKIFLIFLTCFFPIANGFYSGFEQVDNSYIQLMRSMQATKKQLFWKLQFPASLPNFFTGLRIAGAYAIVGAVIAEWMGGNYGLGVYMTRARKSFSFDIVFAVIIVIIILSQFLLLVIRYLEKKAMPWRKNNA